MGHSDRVVLVAQSMGAFSAPLACERAPVDLLVLVYPMIPSPGESAGEWWENTKQPQAQAEYAASQGRNVTDDLLDLFFHDVPADVRSEAIEMGEPKQADTPFRQRWPLTAWPEVPTRVITGRDDRLFPVEFQRRIASERLGIVPDQIAGGHLVALSKPVDLSDVLIRYVAELS